MPSVFWFTVSTPLVSDWIWTECSSCRILLRACISRTMPANSAPIRATNKPPIEVVISTMSLASNVSLLEVSEVERQRVLPQPVDLNRALGFDLDSHAGIATHITAAQENNLTVWAGEANHVLSGDGDDEGHDYLFFSSLNFF